MNQKPATLIQTQGLRAVSKHLDLLQRSAIKALAFEGKGPSEIAEFLGVSRSTVNNVLKNKGGTQQRQRADRFEYFNQGTGSGCYHNGEEMLSHEQLHAGDPLGQVLLEEAIETRLGEEEWD